MAGRSLLEKNEAALIAEARREAAEIAARRGSAAPGAAVPRADPPAAAVAPAGGEPAHAAGDIYARMAMLMEAERLNTQRRKARMRMTGTVIVALFAVPLMVWMLVLILRHLIR